MKKILTPAQAEAVYSAMCALNNVSGSNFYITFPNNGYSVVVQELANNGVVQVERYADQSVFAVSYNLGSAA